MAFSACQFKFIFAPKKRGYGNQEPGRKAKGPGDPDIKATEITGAGAVAVNGVQYDDRRGGKDVQHPDKKRIWHQTVSLPRTRFKGIPLGVLCGLFGYSRQAFYKWNRHEFAEDALEPLIVEKTASVRSMGIRPPLWRCCSLFRNIRY